MGIFSWLGFGNNNQFNQTYPNNGVGTEHSNNELTYWGFDILPIAKS
ncbi:hypothetical protein [Helicobacter pylori]|nr:hypothetical protein [Helicobacter pylori]